MDNQHQKIKGYRDLNQEEIDLINECKQASEDIGKLCDKIEAYKSVDLRWIRIANTDLQKGFMSLIRSIARPETF